MKVSVILLAVKDRGFLKQARASLETQTFTNFEVIETKLKASVGKNLNKAIEKASGDYVCYLCDDDLLPPRSLEARVKVMDRTQADFLHGDAEIIKLSGEVVPYVPRLRYPALEDMLIRNVINGGTAMYRMDIFERFGLFDEELTTAEEYEYNLMLLYQGAVLEYVDECTYIYRKHDKQKSSMDMAKRKAWRLMQIEQIKRRYM